MQTIVMKKAALREGESLCRACYWAHIQKGFRESEEAVFCCFGKFRTVPFEVVDCTHFSNRTVPSRQQMENIALIIPTEPARKRAGFRGKGFTAPSHAEVEETSEEDEVSIED
jgi:hypothetical protein